MMDLERFQKFLGRAGDAYRPEQLPQLRKEMYEMAELLLDVYLDRLVKANRRCSGGEPKRPVDN